MTLPEKGSKLYVAGPMTGKEDWNFPLFFAVSDALRAMGYEPNNPAENDGPDVVTAVAHANEMHRRGTHSWADYMKRDVIRLVSCDGLVVLPGWQSSRGAKLEVGLARDLEMPVWRWTFSTDVQRGGLRPL